MAKNKITYSEPVDFFPAALRKKYRLGEYAETEKETGKKKTTTKSKKK